MCDGLDDRRRSAEELAAQIDCFEQIQRLAHPFVIGDGRYVSPARR